MNQSIEQAKQFAIKAHAKDKYGDLPYEYHLQKVYDIVEEYEWLLREDAVLVKKAAWLHDTIEDTEVEFKDIAEEFGKITARLVYAVTNEDGANRKERAKITYPKMVAAGRNAIALKLADRIANVEHSVKHNHGKFKMYKKEYEYFRSTLKFPGELKEMWARLDLLMATEIED